MFGKFMQDEMGVNKSYLTLEHLAFILELINEMKPASGTENFARKVPGFLTHKGKPNLILCNTRNQIEVLLTIYATSPECPLPSNDEILFCHSLTSSEEVENFLRIAYKSTGTKIYTLLNIQELNYENTIRIERFLSTNHTAKQTDTYRLVFVCCVDKQEQQQQQSILSSLLIKNKINPITMPTNLLEQYLLSKMSTKEPSSLARFDNDRSTCRAMLSKQAGNGKSTCVEFFKRKIQDSGVNDFNTRLIRIKTCSIDLDLETQKLLEIEMIRSAKSNPTLFHVDISSEVFSNVDIYLFNMLVLGYLKHANGLVWRRSLNDIYLVEMMSPYFGVANKTTLWFHSILNFLPKIELRTPQNYLYDLMNTNDLDRMHLFGDNLFKHFYTQTRFQRSASYLKLFKEDPAALSSYIFNGQRRQLSQIECLDLLLKHTELKNPSWAELAYFTTFLDEQLELIERSTLLASITELRGICSRFIIMMAYDFGSPSLNIGSDSTLFNVKANNDLEVQIEKLEIARKWENTAHPYIIFNSDRKTFTFMGIYLDRYKYINAQILNKNFIKL
jgi:hypothetical protein